MTKNLNVGLILLTLVIFYIGLGSLIQFKSWRWDNYREAHHCTIIATMDNRNNRITYLTQRPDNTMEYVTGIHWAELDTAYKCNDGQIYWRD